MTVSSGTPRVKYRGSGVTDAARSRSATISLQPPLCDSSAADNLCHPRNTLLSSLLQSIQTSPNSTPHSPTTHRQLHQPYRLARRSYCVLPSPWKPACMCHHQGGRHLQSVCQKLQFTNHIHNIRILRNLPQRTFYHWYPSRAFSLSTPGWRAARAAVFETQSEQAETESHMQGRILSLDV